MTGEQRLRIALQVCEKARDRVRRGERAVAVAEDELLCASKALFLAEAAAERLGTGLSTSFRETGTGGGRCNQCGAVGGMCGEVAG